MQRPSVLDLGWLVGTPRLPIGVLPLAASCGTFVVPARGTQGCATLHRQGVGLDAPKAHSLAGTGCGGIQDGAGVTGAIGGKARHFSDIARASSKSRYWPSNHAYAMKVAVGINASKAESVPHDRRMMPVQCRNEGVRLG